jgi:hypothetical protein
LAKKSKLYSEHIPGPKKRTSTNVEISKNIEDKERNDEENKPS